MADQECTDVDTRGVVFIKYSSRTDTLGGNYACISYKGKTYKTPEELSKIIWGRPFKLPE